MAADKQAKVAIVADASQATREFDSFGGKVLGVAATVNTSMRGIGGAIQALQGSVLGLGAAVAGSAFVAGAKHQIDLMDATRKAAQAAGVSAQTYSELAYAAKLADVEQEVLTKALAKLGTQMVKTAGGDEALRRLFGQTLGVQVQDATGKLRGTDEVLADIAERFAGMEDGPKKTALAVELLGNKLGPGLIPFLNSGKAGIEDLRAELGRLKGAMTDEQAAAAEAFNDNITRVRTASERLSFQIASATLPMLTALSEELIAVADSGHDTGSEISLVAQIVKTALETVLVVGANVKFVFQGIGREIGAIAAQAVAVMTGNFSGFTAISDAVKADGERARAELEAFERKVMGITDAGGGRGSVNPPGVKRATFDPEPAAITGGSKESRMALWEARLAETRLKLQEQGLAEGQFRDMSKAEEAAYWRQLLTTQSLSAAESVAIRRKVADAALAVNRESFDARLASLQAERDAMEKNYAERVGIAEQAYELIVGKFGAESREALKALGEVAAERRKLADQQRNLMDMAAAVRREESLAALEAIEREARLQVELGLLTQTQLLQIRARMLEERNTIEVAAKIAQIEAMKGGAEDPEAYARLQAELAAIRRRYKAEDQAVQGQQKVEANKPMDAVFGASESAIQQGLQSMVTKMKFTLGGLRDVMRSIGSSMIAELVTKPAAAWLVGQARMVLQTFLFGKQKVAAEAVTAGEIGSIQTGLSLSNIGKSAAEAAANAYKSIAAIPIVGPVLAPAAAIAAMAAVGGLARKIFSAEGGFDIPAGVNPMVQTHQREMILPATLADTVRDMAAVYSGGGGGGGGGSMELKATPLKGGFWVVHQDDMVAAFKRARRANAI